MEQRGVDGGYDTQAEHPTGEYLSGKRGKHSTTRVAYREQVVASRMRCRREYFRTAPPGNVGEGAAGGAVRPLLFRRSIAAVVAASKLVRKKAHG